jgi:RNA polymerase primary sigma factor
VSGEKARAPQACRQPTGDGADQHDLVLAHLAFVVRVARQYTGMGLTFDDLVGEGNLGLLEAAQHYDASRGVKFISYAVWWIRKSILRALSDRAPMIRLPHTQIKKIRALRDAERRLSSDLGRGVERHEISRHLQLSTAKIDCLLQLKVRELSLEEAPGSERGVSLLESLADDRSVDPETALLRKESAILIRGALRHLEHRERTVLACRFGLQGDRASSLRELSERLGLSREAVRLIEKRGRTQLRRLLRRSERSRATVSAGCP